MFIIRKAVLSTDFEERISKQDLEKIQKLRLMDGFFMKLVFEGNIQATELVVNIVLNRNDLKVKKVVGQREIKGLEGHGVRLDIMAQDHENQAHDIEVERQDGDWLRLRARYNSSMMDMVLLPEGEDYKKLIPSYVIFITEHDRIGDGRPLHHYVMKDKSTRENLGDGRHIIFVNGDSTNEKTRLGKLVHDFKCSSPDDMYFKVLANGVRHFKETEGGRGEMSSVLEEITVGAVIDSCRKLGVSEDRIFEHIVESYGLTEERARKYMNARKKSA